MNKDLLYRYFSGTATTEEGMAVKAWMEASEANRAAFFSERRLYDALLLAAPGAPSRRPTRVLGRIGRAVSRVAAVAAVVIFALFLYSRYMQRPDTLTIVSVPAGQRTHITLPDGTGVWLNARSEISYSTSYNTRHRDVNLSGEAYFSVAKNKWLPFVVHTRRFGVEATGTVFNVRSYPETNCFEAALIEGGVNVFSLDEPEKVVRLHPGERAFWRGGALSVAAISHDEDYRWRNGFITFRSERFDVIMRQFERSFGVRVNVHNRKVLEHTYTGKFRQSDGVDYALRVLQHEMAFSYKKNDETETIDIY